VTIRYIFRKATECQWQNPDKPEKIATKTQKNKGNLNTFGGAVTGQVLLPEIPGTDLRI
jgi:hypothetical protein